MTRRHVTDEGVTIKAPTLLHLQQTAGFGGWLSSLGGFLAVTTLAGETLLVLSSDENGKLIASLTHIGFARGLVADKTQMWIAGDTRIWHFGNIGPRRVGEVDHDACYVLRAGHFTGTSLLHDLARDVTFRGKRNKIVFVNTSFSVIATLDPRHSFRPLWAPKFLSRLAPEDRCHLNSFALRDGELAYATVFSETDGAEGWRRAGDGAGVVIDIATDEIVCRGLTAPHTPRWHRDRLWLANSMLGEFGFVDLARGTFECVASLGGFVRGFAIVGDHAVVGMSSKRPSSCDKAPDIPGLSQAVAKTSGLFVVNLETGNVDHALTITGSAGLYDVAHVPDIKRPLFIKTPEAPDDHKMWTTFSSAAADRVLSGHCRAADAAEDTAQPPDTSAFFHPLAPATRPSFEDQRHG